jgi:tripartite ATP-independent transporter DctP family solute receptor
MRRAVSALHAVCARGFGLLRSFLRAGSRAAVALLAGFGSMIAVEGREFRAADIQEESYPAVQALGHMDQLVTERTGGHHRIRVFHSGQLGDEGQTIAQGLAGVIDINRVNVVELGKIAPALNVLALPYLFRSTEHLHHVIDGPIGDEILASLDPSGFIGLSFYDAGARSIYTTTKAVRTFADLNGLRLRVLESDLMGKMVRALGAEPVNLPYRQLITALSTKLIDGAESNWPSFVTSGHYKVAPYYALTEHTRGPSVVIMSRRAWDELSPQERTIFRDAARESSKYIRAEWQSLEEQFRTQAAAGGVTISNPDRKPFENATKPLRYEFHADPELGQLIDRIQAVE